MPAGEIRASASRPPIPHEPIARLGGRVPKWFGVAPALAVLVGCGDAAPESASFTESDSAGIRIVQSVAPAWGAESPRIDPEPVLRIGREEPGPHQLAFVTNGLLLGDGSIAIAEARAQEVRIFDAAGAHVTTFGARGEGPGEFQGLARIVRYAGDSVAAYDGLLGRTTFFSRSSGGYRTLQNEMAGNYGLLGVVPDGPILLFDGGGSFRPDLEPGLQWVPTSVVAMERADGASRTIATLPHALRRVASDGNAPMPMPMQHSVQAVGPGGFHWGTSDRWEIGFYDPAGNLLRLARRPGDPRAVEPAMIERYVEDQLERVRRSEGEAALPRYRQRYEDEEYLDVLPHFTTAFVDHEDRLWVGSSEWPELTAPPRLWSVFSPEGRWLGDLQAPEGVRIVDATAELVLGIGRDAFDVPVVQLHRLGI